MSLPPLFVLRHGETEWNRQGRLQGALDSPLTQRGIAQAERQRDILAGLNLDGAQWLISPQGRTRHTAQIAMEGRVGSLTEDARLREIDMGRWTGATRDQIAEEDPALDGLSIYLRVPDGEPLDGVAQRLRAVLSGLTRPTVIITHGLTSRILRCLATDGDLARFAEIGGGQGVVYRIEDGRQNLLE